MNIKDYWSVIYRNIFRDKKKRYFILVMIVCTTLVFGVLVFRNNFFSYLDDNISKNIGFRTLVVSIKTDVKDYGKSEILTVKNIVDVYSSEYNSITLTSTLKTEDLNGEVELLYGGLSVLPKVTKGLNIEDGNKNVAVCPVNFYPDSSVYEAKLNRKYMINGNDMLGKHFTVKYYSYSIDGIIIEEKEEFTKDFEIIGVYDSAKIMNLNNQCYISTEDIKEITETSSLNQYSTGIAGFFAVVDNSENIEKVITELEELGYLYTSVKNQIDNSTVDMIMLICNVVISFILVIVIIVTSTFVKKKILNDFKTIGVLRTIGYNKRIVTSIYIYEFIGTTIFACILGMIFFILIFLALKGTVIGFLEYYGIKIIIHFLDYMYTFVIIVLCTTTIAIYNINTKTRLEIVSLIGSGE